MYLRQVNENQNSFEINLGKAILWYQPGGSLMSESIWQHPRTGTNHNHDRGSEVAIIRSFRFARRTAPTTVRHQTLRPHHDGCQALCVL